MTERIRRTVSEVGGVAEGVRAVSDTLEVVARQTAGDAARALAVAGDALSAAETVGAATSRAAGRMRELELALTRIDAATEEEARAIKHAGTVVTEVNEAVHDSRQTLAGVLEATRAAVAAAQQGRHSALRTVAALELIRLPGSADAHLTEDLERGQAAANECDAALREIAREADEARNQLWDVAGALTESGARAGAVTRQLTDISAVVDETAHSSHTMSAASREIISEVEAMAAGTDAALQLVRQARAHVTSIAGANQRLLQLSERIGALARELDAVTSQFPRP
jgi:chromosome segregation ATPase